MRWSVLVGLAAGCTGSGNGPGEEIPPPEQDLTPVLERPVRPELTCAEEVAPAEVTDAPLLFQWSRRVAPDRIEVLGTGPSQDLTAKALHQGVIGVDGQWTATAFEWVVGDGLTLGSLAGDRAVWLEGFEPRALVVAPLEGTEGTRVPLEGDIYGVSAASTSAGTSVFVAGSAGLLHVAVRDDGTVSGPHRLDGSTYAPPSAVPFGDGAAVVWVDDALQCRFASVDAGGDVTLGPWTTSAPGEPCAAPLFTALSSGGGLIAQSRFGDGTTQQELVRIDGGGPQPAVPLTAPVPDDVSQERPSFVDLGDRVGLFWSEGVYAVGGICAGCIPDHQLHYVVLDPEVLVPVSEPVSLAWTAYSAGLFGGQAAEGPQGLHVTFEVTLHAAWSAGHAVLDCG